MDGQAIAAGALAAPPMLPGEAAGPRPGAARKKAAVEGEVAVRPERDSPAPVRAED